MECANLSWNIQRDLSSVPKDVCSKFIQIVNDRLTDRSMLEREAIKEEEEDAR